MLTNRFLYSNRPISRSQQGSLGLSRAVRCPVFDRTVRFFGDLSGQKYDAKPGN